ncbi:deoxyguanosinetriphosphate triphosphohydrolase [Kribbella flavida DSM 17836]|uniref:Deoxyguanosinetriphosphate triphosphohydrolase n=1 Tax=Kribbella flavida (strain DSM 17836 / JCM 10339 / NBRC 14399) TaxID=479435 RepID=D2PWC7_KRIFD|nr:deoxyguanosinetriphosphate triphosphohydrolase [Kribbella flavida]ADB31579.1 deoxyguanosinetriphosphate triphosphohydrolase [Kribbella flavida DSM 17836]
MRKQSEGYDEHDAERWVAEPVKRPGRTAFARDRARVLHSAGLRRLAAKTQVATAGSDDFVRNRLTHSLEVAQIGRELAGALGCDPDIVDAACLAHDLGHPPFGHNGERALDQLAADIGGFEGNAQTLRLLTRLESKTFTPDGRSAGLNLSRATLDAATKYPWPRRAGVRKFGVYDDDLEVFEWLRQGLGDERCLEAQVMDFADDVAYSVHDVEDGIVAHSIDLDRVGAERARYWQTVRDAYLPDATDAELDEGWDRLTALPYWPRAPFDDSRRALGGLKDLTSQLIGRFCTAAEQATRARFGRGAHLVRYDADLVIPDAVRAEIALLKGVGMFHVLNSPELQHRRAIQRELLTELVEALCKTAPDNLDAPFAADFRAAPDDATRLRVVIDQVASLTDPSAQAWHRHLTG